MYGKKQRYIFMLASLPEQIISKR